LAERREDIPLLATTLLARISPKRNLRLHPDAIATLKRCNYPGNIRELRNILERASLMADGDTVMTEHLTMEDDGAHQLAPAYPPTIIPLEDAERQYLQWADENYQGDRRMLAKLLGISERTLYRKLQD
jgi:DNA-binding NtrC family response regulator